MRTADRLETIHLLLSNWFRHSCALQWLDRSLSYLLAGVCIVDGSSNVSVQVVVVLDSLRQLLGLLWSGLRGLLGSGLRKVELANEGQSRVTEVIVETIVEHIHAVGRLLVEIHPDVLSEVEGRLQRYWRGSRPRRNSITSGVSR